MIIHPQILFSLIISFKNKHQKEFTSFGFQDEGVAKNKKKIIIFCLHHLAIICSLSTEFKV